MRVEDQPYSQSAISLEPLEPYRVRAPSTDAEFFPTETISTYSISGLSSLPLLDQTHEASETNLVETLPWQSALYDGRSDRTGQNGISLESLFTLPSHPDGGSSRSILNPNLSHATDVVGLGYVTEGQGRQLFST